LKRLNERFSEKKACAEKLASRVLRKRKVKQKPDERKFDAGIVFSNMKNYCQGYKTKCLLRETKSKRVLRAERVVSGGDLLK